MLAQQMIEFGGDSLRCLGREPLTEQSFYLHNLQSEGSPGKLDVHGVELGWISSHKGTGVVLRLQILGLVDFLCFACCKIGNERRQCHFRLIEHEMIDLRKRLGFRGESGGCWEQLSI